MDSTRIHYHAGWLTTCSHYVLITKTTERFVVGPYKSTEGDAVSAQSSLLNALLRTGHSDIDKLLNQVELK